MTTILQRVVEAGTGEKARPAGYTAAGKTGTAQKIDETGHYSRGKYVASFVGFAPASDPRIIIAVMVDEPSNGRHYGGDVAAPVFAAVASNTLRAMNVAPDSLKTSIVIPADGIKESI